MSYNIVYAPELGQVVNAASGASGAIAAAEQQRFYDQLGEQQRQFDYGQMLRAEQIGLADAQSRAALGLRAYESDQYNALRRDQLGMNYELAQQEMAQQEAYRQAQIEQAQFQAQQQAVAALAREHGASMRQRQDQNFKSFITQLDAINTAAQEGQIDENQLQAAYAQLEQQSGFPVWLPAEMSKQEMFQAQAAQQQQVAETIAGAFSGVLQEGEQLPPASAFMTEGKNGEMVFDSGMMWKEVQDRRANQRQSENDRRDAELARQLKELDLEVKASKEASKEQESMEADVAASFVAAEKYAQKLQEYEARQKSWDNTQTGVPPVKPSPASIPGFIYIREPSDPRLQSLPPGTPILTPEGLRYVK